MAEVVAVCRVHQLLPDRGIGVTAIDKRPVDKQVRIRRLGLHGDVQADRHYHGGEDQAVYAYAEEDAAWFARDLGRDAPPPDQLRLVGTTAPRGAREGARGVLD